MKKSTILIFFFLLCFLTQGVDCGTTYYLCKFNNNTSKKLHIIADPTDFKATNALSYYPIDIESINAYDKKKIFALVTWINDTWSERVPGSVRVFVFEHLNSSFVIQDLNNNVQRIDSINTYANCLVCYILKHDQLDDCRYLCYPPTEDMRDIEMIPPFDEVIENAKKHH